jgi:hypothetical protein
MSRSAFQTHLKRWQEPGVFPRNVLISTETFALLFRCMA